MKWRYSLRAGGFVEVEAERFLIKPVGANRRFEIYRDFKDVPMQQWEYIAWARTLKAAKRRCRKELRG